MDWYPMIRSRNQWRPPDLNLLSVGLWLMLSVIFDQAHRDAIIWATSWENMFTPHANNKGADQPAHPRSLISAFVVRCLDSIPVIYIRNFKPLASFCGYAGRFVSYLVANPKTGFLVTRLYYCFRTVYSICHEAWPLFNNVGLVWFISMLFDDALVVNGNVYAS